MGQCGPIDPCDQCKPMYRDDPDWIEDEKRPGSYRLTTVADRRLRKMARMAAGAQRRRAPTKALAGRERLPVSTGSRRTAKRLASARRRRTS